ncbi:AAA_15 domain-containing protein [Pseudomonas sp. OF001]|uniref:ATP-binding protein n=1 Tax=Pseudomonas sp. OF001 TaxID=2772300 RepID=UPI001917E8B2|nr:ATP-binding protein [Pseudomonas sp. OF001]CAD5375811.1 AAA_15 domain-containing protein [Pseudomonas sp. OF001]
MRLKAVYIKNFRCYADKIKIPLDELTTIIGKNDIGKSSILEALEIFFNNDTVSVDPSDANVKSEDKRVEICCEFDDLPTSMTLDAGAETTLANEHLLTEDGTLKILKTFNCANKKPTEEVFIIANHPTAAGFNNLLELKEKELQAKVKELGLDVPLKGNPGMRQAIWASAPDLSLAETIIPAGKAKEDTKKIWEQIESHLPIFALFQSDRSSRDSDDEVQSPMKAAIAAAIAEVQDDITNIQRRVQEKAEEIAHRTHDALKTLDSNLANELTPEFSAPTPAKWTSLFSVGLNTDSGIPLNKRGSGVRRLVLVSFFKAEAERRLKSGSRRNIIYAIEEPETAQHPNNQRLLIESFKTLSEEVGCQVLLTTHSPGLAAKLPSDSIRFVTRNSTDGKPIILLGADAFGPVADALGVTPDSRVQVLLCVEGPNDVACLKALSKATNATDPTLPDLDTDERIAFVVLGGATLQHWVNRHYLQSLKKPEVHIYDGDVADYRDSVAQVNARTDGSWGAITSKHEIESYLHPDAIVKAFGFRIAVTDHPAEGKATPKVFAEAYTAHQGHGAVLKDSTAKKHLANKAFPCMTAAMLQERDPQGEVVGWFRRIGEMLI